MNILEIIEESIEDGYICYESAKLKESYVTLVNLQKENPNHKIFQLDFYDLTFIDENTSVENSKYLRLLSPENCHIEYQLIVDKEDVWLGYDDDYSLPMIKLYKVEPLEFHTYVGDEEDLHEDYREFDEKFTKEDEDMDEIHRIALIENYEWEINKLLK